ncbi:MAG TPA: amino acid ABC transporter permease [Candidatus Dormibacteraeota bacterium]|nr:amino acid ABC transporter permease [Candidatus Dormibacteraeota bacterium]
MTDIASGSPAPGGRAGQRPEAIKAMPVRHPWRWISAVVVLLIAADAIYTLISAPNMSWSIVGKYLFQRLILEGVTLTLALTVVAMAIGIVLGVVLAVMRISVNPVMSAVSWFYIWFFRGTPVVVQIFFWWNLAIILPHLGLGIPPNGPWLVSASTNQLIMPFTAAMLGLGLNEAAYMAEIVRAGIISVEHGQTEAAQALGMTRLQVMQRIVLPQAMRVIIPPTGNETISMLKTTSLAFVATVPELYTRAQQISSANFAVIELLTVISLWYLFLTSILTVGQYYIERYFARGSQRELPATPFQRFRQLFFAYRPPTSGPPLVNPMSSERGKII